MIPAPASRLRRRLRKAALLLILLAALFVGAVAGLYPFLAPDRPADSPVMVIEGWLADAPLEEALSWADAHGVKTLYLTGGPISTGSWLAPWKSYPEMTLARLRAMGVADRYDVRAFPAPDTRKDRTWISAVTLRDALGADCPPSMTLASEGPHLRRSSLLFRRAFGGRCRIGTLPLTPTDFDSRDWWRCSAGVRCLLSEAIAYPYALLTRPGEAPKPPRAPEKP